MDREVLFKEIRNIVADVVEVTHKTGISLKVIMATPMGTIKG